MKAVLEFNLDDSDDVYRFKEAQQAASYRGALLDVSQKIRAWRKYDERVAIPIEELSEMFWECVNSNEARLDLT